MPNMKRTRSIKARLACVFLMLFLLVILIGIEALHSLSSVNDASSQIRLRWLPSTSALGDLNNYTTDFPAAEAALAHAGGVLETEAIKRQMEHLDRDISAAQRAYEQIRHDPAEAELYGRFAGSWSEYRRIVDRSVDRNVDRNVDRSVDRSASWTPEVRAVGEPRDPASKAAYESASVALGLLTDRNIAGARAASESSDLAYAEARGRIGLTIVLAGILVAGAMLHVTRSISAPLVQLAFRMHRLAASETGIDVQGTQRHDEIGEMARAVVVFRNNAIDLAENRRALAQQAATLEEKLAEEQRLTVLQRNFVSMASHEFRTPLAIIDGHAQRLISMRDRLSGVELVERARKVRSTVRRLTQLIDNLIGSARLIDGGIDLNYHPRQVDLVELIREVCCLQQELTPDAQILEPPKSSGAPRLTVFGDAGLLSQVFGNLLSNAVKYSPDGGLIRVTAAQDGTDIVVAIDDEGIGIPDSDRERVFERYYRGSNTSGIPGSGVGLYLVRTIIELHKGSIALHSREGEGSQFILRLPHDSTGVLPIDQGPPPLESNPAAAAGPGGIVARTG
jgi:signal transduction histidine kinase